MFRENGGLDVDAFILLFFAFLSCLAVKRGAAGRRPSGRGRESHTRPPERRALKRARISSKFSFLLFLFFFFHESLRFFGKKLLSEVVCSPSSSERMINFI